MSVLDLLVLTDGRDDYLHATIESIRVDMHGSLDLIAIHDDTGDDAHRQMLAVQYPDFRVIGDGPRRGFGGAYKFAFETLSVVSDAEYVVTIEGDFTLNRPVELADMAGVLSDRPHLIQMALVRQAWNQAEKDAGGLLEAHPGAFVEHSDFAGNRWMEHRAWVTSNAAVWPRWVIDRGWPDCPRSEGVLSLSLFEDPSAFAGYWGAMDDGPWITHIGEERAHDATGY